MNFYFDAAKVLDKLDAKQGSIKGIVSTLPEKDRKRTAALVIETLKYKAVLSDVIRAADLLKHERQKLTSPNLALLLVHDLLLSKGKIQASDGPIKQAVLRHKIRLQSELTKIQVRRGAKSVTELAQEGDTRADLIPRYVRVNTLIWSTEDAVRHFVSQGYKEEGDPLTSKKAFQRDQHISDLILFHPSTPFNDSPLLDSGKIILQDKASCFPAVILSPPAHGNAYVIDATAAPGNKTTLLSALMKGRGKLYAFERDKKRFSTLKKMVARAHCGNVEPTNADFLAADPHDARYSRVSHILVDPSCSGSGIVNRLDHLLEIGEPSLEDENDLDAQEERLQKLAAFQLSMIKHAMKFPAVEKIVYSTCSVHAAENEDVVSQALASDEAKNGNFFLADRGEVLPTWPRRGLPERMRVFNIQAESLIRCIPGDDHTNGFFVSCFIRKKSGTETDHGASEADTGRKTLDEKRDNSSRKRQVDDDEVKSGKQHENTQSVPPLGKNKRKRRKK
ncbi:hypothetical protein ACEPAH_8108 [Sanghuangporus vaninii]